MGVQMKGRAWLTGGVVMAACLAAAPVGAQEVRATVPFDFSVGNTPLPAGTYTIDDASDPGLLCLRRLDGKAAAFVVTTPDRQVDLTTTPELVFVRVGDVYHLESIEMDDGLVRELALPSELQKAARDRVSVRMRSLDARAN